MQPEFDDVIVGAGSAGCVLAERLTRVPGRRVLLLEAGGWDRDPWIRIPLGFGRIRQRRLHDWGFETEPQDALDGRRLECRRGRVVGGSSSINAMVYVRGHAADYDRWAATGLAGWSYRDVLPRLRRQECWEGGGDAVRGGDGPLATRRSRFDDPLTDALIAAGVALGHPVTDDYNRGDTHGLGRLQFTIRDGYRCSAADAFLRPARARPGLRVVTRALVTRVLLERGRAVGVEYLHGGQVCRARARREVLLCGGVVNTPQLLMLSGVGDPQELEAHGLDVVVPLPGVGRNLQDHVMAPLAYPRRVPGPLHRHMRADRIVADLVRGYAFGHGFASDVPSPLAAFLKTDPGLAAPDIQVMLHTGPVLAHPYLQPFVAPYADAFALLVVLLHPRSRGRIRLASAEPRAAPRIDGRLLDDPEDRRVLARGLRLVSSFASQSAMRAYVGGAAAALPDDAAALETRLRATVGTVHHPAGSCRMGPPDDPMAVVDAQLRVFGVDGLRVVDASVMPDLVGGNIAAAVMMIADRAGEAACGSA